MGNSDRRSSIGLFEPVHAALRALDVDSIPQEWVDLQFGDSFCDQPSSPWGKRDFKVASTEKCVGICFVRSGTRKCAVVNQLGQG